ncbi:VanZ family protein [Paractinoplanes deccanensis]|uniref:VanZ family protein n=1 Tax=Paractinoplanes deccanensis TaxID=113561 RepID=UPI0019427885|nr:VanZ family protein [Actinoplanes deccanensis]
MVAIVLFALLAPLVTLPWIHLQYSRYGRLRGWTAVVAASEVLYLCGLVAFTLFPLPNETAAFCAARTTADFLNVNPLDDVAATPAAVAQILLNVALFVPLGFLLRYRFGRRAVAATAIGFAVSLLVEVTQGTAVFGLVACPYRVADTGDLITNTAGTLAGWWLAGAIGRLLPPAEPVPSPDLERPGLVRRGLSVAADLLIGLFATEAVVLALTVAGVPDAGRPVLAGCYLTTYVISTLVVPLRRRDHATLGQATFFLAPGSRAAVWPRFLLWWLPAGLLQGAELLYVIFWAALVIGVLARLRADRRSVLELVSGTTTITRRAALVR